MANMSYCRFENTSEDVADCLGTLESGERISAMEIRRCKEMFQDFLKYCEEIGIIEAYDMEPLDTYLKSVKR